MKCDKSVGVNAGAFIIFEDDRNDGDMKSVQGDAGHAQMKMVADVYLHVIDEDRKQNAIRFEKEFYSREGDAGTMATRKEPEKKETDQEALLRILSNPGIWQIPYVCSAFIIIRHNCNLD